MVVGVILLGLIGWGSHSNYQAADRHVFTWISRVTPELAGWVRDMNFTDVIVVDSSVESLQNLDSQGITYWWLVSAQSLDADAGTLRQQLAVFANTSPNGHVYLDDSHYILEKYGTSVASNLFDAIREIQSTSNSRFILDGYIDSNLSGLYSQLNMTGIDFDVYQPLKLSYQPTIRLLEMANPASLGIYLWAYLGGDGLCWSLMTESYLTSFYNQAKENGLTRLVIWNGYVGMDELLQSLDPVGIYMACLYYYPDWWDKVRTENMEFIEGN